VRALHSYETPEIIALAVTEASAPYLTWLTETVMLQRYVQPHTETAATAGGGLKEG
jgi:hypothetical protein